MLLYMSRFLFIVLFVLQSVILSAQNKQEFDPVKDDIADFIPPLSVLMDSALQNDPKVDFRNLDLEINERKLKSTKRDWAKNLGVQADFRYGTFDNYALDAGNPNASYIYTTHEEFKFGYAAYVKFPLLDFYNRRNQVQIANVQKMQAESLLQLERNDKRQVVIRQYNELILAQKILRIKSKSLETARINMQMAEQQFMNGVIPVTEYARLSDIVASTEVDYETSKMNFLTAYQLLEEIIGYSFNVSNEMILKNEGN